MLCLLDVLCKGLIQCEPLSLRCITLAGTKIGLDSFKFQVHKY